MNTIQNLIDNGIDMTNAERMISEYKKRIGTVNGVYKIKDITYDFSERGLINGRKNDNRPERNDFEIEIK